MAEPLDGIHVVLMGTAFQAPAAAAYLADMGAQVVRLERPEGDGSMHHRGVNNFHPEGTPGTMYIMTSRGSRSVVVDIHTELGREAVDRLVRSADVFISNYLESSLNRLGFGYEALRELNPGIIYAVASGFGPEGPDADKRMIDGAAQARGGLINSTGPADGPPMMPGVALADTAGAMQLALAIMTALVVRERCGIGQRVATSAYGGQIWLQMWEITQSSLTGVELRRAGAHHPNIPGTTGVYGTADGGSIFLAFHTTEESWQAFCAFAGMPEVGTDERWNSVQKRLGMGFDAEGRITSLVRPHLERAFRSKTTDEWVAFLDSEPDIIYNRVYSYADVLSDPQALVNGYIVEKEIPLAGRHKVVGVPIHLSETPGSAKDLIPELGQHTEEVLLELGFSWDEIVTINAQSRENLRQKFIALGQEPPY